MSRSISARISWLDVHDQKTWLLDDVIICYTAPLNKSESYSVSAPYSVFYRIRAVRVVALAVFHNKRNPNIWKSRA